MRNISVDWLRGIAIFIVVWSHIALGPLLDEITNPVILGIFFLLSGMFHRSISIKELAKKKAKTLLAPWMLFVAVGYMYHLFFAFFIDHTGFRWTMIIDDLFDGKDYEANIPCWFFISLFETILLYAICEKLFSSTAIRMTTLCMLSVLGNIALVFGLNGFYWGKTLFYVFLFGIGVYIHNRLISRALKIKYCKKWFASKFYVTIATILLVVVLGIIKIRYISSQFLDYIIGSIMAIVITVVVTCLRFNSSSPIKWYVSVPAYLGKNSLVILGFHIIASDFLWRMLYPYFHTPDLKLSFLYAVMTVALCIPIIFVYNRYVSSFLR